MKEAFTVTVTARGEGLDYGDEDGVFLFNRSRAGSTIQLHAYDPKDAAFQGRHFSAEQRKRILPRVIAHLPLVPKVSEALWERVRALKLRFPTGAWRYGV